MIFYLIVYLASIGLAISSDCLLIRNKKGRSFFLYALSGVVLAAVRGLRYGIGIDYFYTYVPRFYDALNGMTTRNGIIIDSFIRLIGFFSADYRVYFFIDSLLFILLVYLCIWISCDQKAIPVAMFCVTYHYLRSFIFQTQYLASALMLLSCCLLLRKCKTRIVPVGCCVLAISIHLSSAVLLIVWLPLFFKCFEKKRQINLLLVSLLPILALLFRGAVPTLLHLLESTPYGGYLGSSYDDGEFSWQLLLINLCIFLFMLYAFHHFEKLDSGTAKFFLLTQSIALSLSCLTGTIPLLYRVIYYFMFLQVVSVPLFTLSLNKNRLMASILAVLLFGLVQFAYLLPKDTDWVVPYCSVFNTEDLPSDSQLLQNQALTEIGVKTATE